MNPEPAAYESDFDFEELDESFFEDESLFLDESPFVEESLLEDDELDESFDDELLELGALSFL